MFVSCSNLHLNMEDAVYVAVLLEPKLECIQICQIIEILKSTFLSHTSFTFCQMMIFHVLKMNEWMNG